ncbi:hypothetical protein V5O48_014750 [Marasmius crinis-equi]|uniref:HTH CENPB-type domain-containing protein n=1 Tax=Marasmius crinis-equi TaxID=585013 RepID=A0ABR3EWE3_9AGAR
MPRNAEYLQKLPSSLHAFANTYRDIHGVVNNALKERSSRTRWKLAETGLTAASATLRLAGAFSGESKLPQSLLVSAHKAVMNLRKAGHQLQPTPLWIPERAEIKRMMDEGARDCGFHLSTAKWVAQFESFSIASPQSAGKARTKNSAKDTKVTQENGEMEAENEHRGDVKLEDGEADTDEFEEVVQLPSSSKLERGNESRKTATTGPKSVVTSRATDAETTNHKSSHSRNSQNSRKGKPARTRSKEFGIAGWVPDAGESDEEVSTSVLVEATREQLKLVRALLTPFHQPGETPLRFRRGTRQKIQAFRGVPAPLAMERNRHANEEGSAAGPAQKDSASGSEGEKEHETPRVATKKSQELRRARAVNLSPSKTQKGLPSPAEDNDLAQPEDTVVTSTSPPVVSGKRQHEGPQQDISRPVKRNKSSPTSTGAQEGDVVGGQSKLSTREIEMERHNDIQVAAPDGNPGNKVSTHSYSAFVSATAPSRLVALSATTLLHGVGPVVQVEGEAAAKLKSWGASVGMSSEIGIREQLVRIFRHREQISNLATLRDSLNAQLATLLKQDEEYLSQLRHSGRDPKDVTGILSAHDPNFQADPVLLGVLSSIFNWKTEDVNTGLLLSRDDSGNVLIKDAEDNILFRGYHPDLPSGKTLYSPSFPTD